MVVHITSDTPKIRCQTHRNIQPVLRKLGVIFWAIQICLRNCSGHLTGGSSPAPITDGLNHASPSCFSKVHSLIEQTFKLLGTNLKIPAMLSFLQLMGRVLTNQYEIRERWIEESSSQQQIANTSSSLLKSNSSCWWRPPPSPSSSRDPWIFDDWP